MKIKNIKIEDIKPYPGNAKAHPPAQIKKIARSIREYGFQVPILLDKDNVIIAGHARLLAAGQLKMETVPTVRMDHLTEAQIRAFRLMDNRSNESDWLEKELAEELQMLSEVSFDLELTGFDGDEIEALLGIKLEDGLTDQDEIPEAIKPVVNSGELWLLGKHRLLCGDATKQEEIERLMDGTKADMIFTDPPYGINYKYHGYKDTRENYNEFMRIVWKLVDDSIFNSSAIYIKQYLFNVFEMYQNLPSEWKYKNLIIWRSMSQAHPKDNYDNNIEPIFFLEKNNDEIYHEYLDDNGTLIYYIKGNPYFNKEAEKRKSKDPIGNQAGRLVKMNNIWDDIKKITGGCIRSKESTSVGSYKQHSCQMPVGLAERGINFSTKNKNKVLDIFLGSGTTLIACEKTKRICYGMEIDEHYCDVILQRWANYTGKDPVREDGASFKELTEKAKSK
jgi:DNA modification methylase